MFLTKVILLKCNQHPAALARLEVCLFCLLHWFECTEFKGYVKDLLIFQRTCIYLK